MSTEKIFLSSKEVMSSIETLKNETQTMIRKRFLNRENKIAVLIWEPWLCICSHNNKAVIFWPRYLVRDSKLKRICRRWYDDDHKMHYCLHCRSGQNIGDHVRWCKCMFRNSSPSQNTSKILNSLIHLQRIVRQGNRVGVCRMEFVEQIENNMKTEDAGNSQQIRLYLWEEEHC